MHPVLDAVELKTNYSYKNTASQVNFIVMIISEWKS